MRRSRLDKTRAQKVKRAWQQTLRPQPELHALPCRTEPLSWNGISVPPELITTDPAQARLCLDVFGVSVLWIPGDEPRDEPPDDTACTWAEWDAKVEAFLTEWVQEEQR